MKDQHCPYLRPQKINSFIGIGSRQREFLDDLLPGDGVDSAVGYHQEQEQLKQILTVLDEQLTGMGYTPEEIIRLLQDYYSL